MLQLLIFCSFLTSIALIIQQHIKKKKSCTDKIFFYKIASSFSTDSYSILFFLPFILQNCGSLWMIGRVSHVEFLHTGGIFQKHPSHPALVRRLSAITEHTEISVNLKYKYHTMNRHRNQRNFHIIYIRLKIYIP